MSPRRAPLGALFLLLASAGIAGTPPAVTRRLQQVVTKIMANPENHKKIAIYGGEVMTQTGDQVTAMIKAESSVWAKSACGITGTPPELKSSRPIFCWLESERGKSQHISIRLVSLMSCLSLKDIVTERGAVATRSQTQPGKSLLLPLAVLTLVSDASRKNSRTP